MTTEEFSNEFDALLPGFNEYEKSVLLTKSQEELIISFYNGKNNFRESFEDTEEIRRYLNELIKTCTFTTSESSKTSLSDSSIFYTLPDDLWFITYESVIVNDQSTHCNITKAIPVVPVTQDEYSRISSNPFRTTNNRRALRLDADDNTVEIISKCNVDKYIVRYLSRPDPIILTDLTDNLSINSISTKTECKLNSALHRAILINAIKMVTPSTAPKNNSEDRQRD